MHEDHEIGKVSDVFLSGKAIIDTASLFTVIMMRGVFLYMPSTLDSSDKKILKLSIALISKGDGMEGREGKKKNLKNIYDKY